MASAVAAAPSAAPPSAAPPPDFHVHLIVVAGQRREASLACASSLLRLQTSLMAAPERIRADLHFVQTIDDALNTLHRADAGVDGALVVGANIGFEPEFALRCLRARRELVIASYPVPSVDWARVEACGKDPATTEPPDMWGNTYNVDVEGAADAQGFSRVGAVRELGLFWIAAGVLRRVVERHPEIVSAQGRAAFCVPGVFDGQYLSAEARFASLVADHAAAVTVLSLPAASCGPAEFGGCVGARAVLR